MKTTSIYDEYVSNTLKQEQPQPSSINIKSVLELDTLDNDNTGNELYELKYEYNIGDYIDNDFKNISKSATNVVVCIYKISNLVKQYGTKYPFLQYLLYKYPKEDSKVSDLLTFPFFKLTNTNSIDVKANAYIKKLLGTDNIQIKGFIEDNNIVYLFAEYNMDTKTGALLFKKTSKNNYWWALIDDICNKKNILNFPIHKSVYNLFYKNQYLIYLLLNKKKIPIPTSLYYGNHYDSLKKIISLEKLNTSGIILTTYKRSFKYGGWLYDSFEPNNLTDIDGKYKRGGIIAVAAFIENYKDFTFKININILDLLENKKKYNFPLGYSSISLDKNQAYNIDAEFIEKINKKYIIPVSFFEIDKTALPPLWDSNYNDYKII